jgi:hypothetical protein
MNRNTKGYLVAAILVPVVALTLYAEMLNQMLYTSGGESLQSYAKRLSGSATETYLASKRRDSLLAGSRTTSVLPRLAVAMDPRISPPVADSLQAMLRETWSRVTPSAGAQVLVAFLLDTARVVDGLHRSSGPFVRYALPRRPGEPCVVLVSLTSPGTQLKPSAVDLTTSYCSLYYAFGHPWMSIERWIASHRHETARYLEWWTEVVPHQPETARAYRGPSARDSLDEPVGLLSCLTGRTADCEELLAETSHDRPVPSRWWTTLPVRGSVLEQYPHWSGRTTIAMGPWFITQLVREHGPERFGKFWTSGDSVGESFRNAYGESLGDHVHHWLAGIYGAEAPAGKVSTAGILQTILSAALLAVVATLLARRWEIR